MVVKRNYTQDQRRIGISTPLGKDVLLLHSFTGSDSMSRPFRFDLDLLSENDSIGFADIVGQRVTTRVILADGSERHWNGFVSRFSQGRRDANLTSYHAEMVPWLWFLTRTADCRIFQNQSVPDIVQKILGDLGFQDFELRLYGSYQPRTYCVQYRETDFNFISRLLEEEGIFYFFEHEKSLHKLVLADDPAAHKPCPGQPKTRYELSAGGWQEDDVVTEWRLEQRFQPGSWAHTDYNFETPGTDLMASVAGANPYEIYDYPGEYGSHGEGDTLVKVRLQEETAPGLVARGTSDCRAFTPGFLFDLEDHYRADLNKSYLITSVRHRASQAGDYVTGTLASNDRDFTYENVFSCMPASVPFRPRRVTPRPTVHGCQTAVVVGPGGEEIYTDQYGRVKVQFHWDREGKRNENSSCWVRVSQPWAGSGWGGLAIPRIGQEVVIDFLEGDPDQPIIVGRVYNAGQMPPFGLPGGAVISGFKSNSTKGGGGYNEISLDDTKGTELINVHAQYDKQKKVEHDERVDVGNDRTEHVGHDEKITIDNNRTEKVGVDENITIGSNRTEQVGSNENIKIGNNRTESVGVNETISIGSNRTETVGANEMITVALTRTRNVGVNEMVNVGGAQEITIGGLQALTVGVTRAKTIGTSETVGIGTSQAVTIGTTQTVGIGKSQSVSVGTDQNLNVGKKRSTSIGTDDMMKVGKTWAVEAGDQIGFKTGKASLIMKKDGTVAIQCKDLTIKASGKVNVKASGKITMKGQQILEN
jgi:type VI secretion system secreted protein VgrG